MMLCGGINTVEPAVFPFAERNISKLQSPLSGTAQKGRVLLMTTLPFSLGNQAG